MLKIMANAVVTCKACKRGWLGGWVFTTGADPLYQFLTMMIELILLHPGVLWHILFLTPSKEFLGFPDEVPV